MKIEGVERDGAEIQFTGMDSEERHVLPCASSRSAAS